MNRQPVAEAAKGIRFAGDGNLAVEATERWGNGLTHKSNSRAINFKTEYKIKLARLLILQ